MWRQDQGTGQRQKLPEARRAGEPVRRLGTLSALSPHSTGPAAGAGRRARQGVTSSLQRTAEVRWTGRRARQGAAGWELVEAAQRASHGAAVLDATLAGDA